MITIDQLKDIKERTAALKQYLSIDEKIIQVEEEQLRTQAPGFWDDAKAAEAQMKKVKSLQSWIDGYKSVHNLTEEVEIAMEMFREEAVTEEEVDDAYARAFAAIEELELKNMLRQEADSMSCVLKINSGAGGTESQDWSEMLMRMDMRWAEAETRHTERCRQSSGGRRLSFSRIRQSQPDSVPRSFRGRGRDGSS